MSVVASANSEGPDWSDGQLFRKVSYELEESEKSEGLE